MPCATSHTELRAAGWQVDEVTAESFSGGLQAWIKAYRIDELRIMKPADRAFRDLAERSLQPLPHPPRPEWVPSNAFLWSRAQFTAWAESRKQLRMESFYREGKRCFLVLMESRDRKALPLGGRWSFDAESRCPPKKGLKPPALPHFSPDSVNRQVMAEAAELPDLPGAVEAFSWPATRAKAPRSLDHFVATRLAGFGPYQDVMVRGEPTMWHSLLSSSLNLALLHLLEVIRKLEAHGRMESIPLNALERVIRQILGWRDHTHGLHRWFGDSTHKAMCLRRTNRCLAGLRRSETAEWPASTPCWARFTVGLCTPHPELDGACNYGLILGLDPQAFTAWFRRMFIDAYDWVVDTNVLGMAFQRSVRGFSGPPP